MSSDCWAAAFPSQLALVGGPSVGPTAVERSSGNHRGDILSSPPGPLVSTCRLSQATDILCPADRPAGLPSLLLLLLLPFPAACCLLHTVGLDLETQPGLVPTSPSLTSAGPGSSLSPGSTVLMSFPPCGGILPSPDPRPASKLTHLQAPLRSPGMPTPHPDPFHPGWNPQGLSWPFLCSLPGLGGCLIDAETLCAWSP